MIWDFAEPNFLADSTGSIAGAVECMSGPVAALSASGAGHAAQCDATKLVMQHARLVSTDPPYYDNIGYADLSDFFYVWLRRNLAAIFPSLLATLAVPKAAELVAIAHRHGGRDAAEDFFLVGMTKAMSRIASQVHPAIPITIYYAFKQAETAAGNDTASTGWETFLAAVIEAGLGVYGTWPLRTEMRTRQVAMETNALASSIVLVCRPRPATAPSVQRREFLRALKTELPQALYALQNGNIAPVDLAQAAIGPGMAVFTRYSAVVAADGSAMKVREALALINQTLDETLAEQHGDLDADTAWAIVWFDERGFEVGEYGRAEMLSKAKVTSVQGLVQAGIAEAKAGRVRLLRPAELSATWDPTTDARLSTWEITHQLIRILDVADETTAGAVVAKLGDRAQTAKDLAYRLYTMCERKRRAPDALAYNSLVQSWPAIQAAALGSEGKPLPAGRRQPTRRTAKSSAQELDFGA